MNKLNLRNFIKTKGVNSSSTQGVFSFPLKSFSKQYEGIKGDVNWANGELLDGRPNLRRGVTNLPKRKYGKVDPSAADLSGMVKEFDNPIYLTYNRRKKGAGKVEDLVMDKKE